MQYSEEKTLDSFKKINTESWDSLKDNVYLQLINSKYLYTYGNVSHRKKLELAIVYSVQENTKDNLITYFLTEDDLKRYNVTQDEVYQTALRNSENNRKLRLVTLSESIMMTNMLYPLSIRIPNATMGVGSNNGPALGMLKDIEEEGENILVTLNKNIPFGASNMFLPKILHEVYERFNHSNFYILPISRHQAWYVKYDYVSHDGQKPVKYIEDDLLDFIEEFNDTQNKTWKDILSYKLYYYMGDDGHVIVPIS